MIKLLLFDILEAFQKGRTLKEKGRKDFPSECAKLCMYWQRFLSEDLIFDSVAKWWRLAKKGTYTETDSLAKISDKNTQCGKDERSLLYRFWVRFRTILNR